MVKKIEAGDIVAIPTRHGTAYAQYTRRIRPYGALVRVLPGVFAEEPADLQAIVDQPEQFWGFVPLAAMIEHEIVTIVGNRAIPEHARSIPLMRVPNGEKGRAGWWLWDGETFLRVDPADPRLPAASLLGTYNDTALIEAIEGGRTPRGDFERWQR